MCVEAKECTVKLFGIELAQALKNSIEVLTNKSSQFAAMHLDALTGVTQRISELKC